MYKERANAYDSYLKWIFRISWTVIFVFVCYYMVNDGFVKVPTEHEEPVVERNETGQNNGTILLHPEEESDEIESMVNQTLAQNVFMTNEAVQCSINQSNQ